MKALILTLILGIAALLWAPAPVWAASVSVSPSAPVKSYREWKKGKIAEAKLRLQTRKQSLQSSLRRDPNLAKKTGPEAHDPESQRMLRQLRNDELELEMALELTVSDYFAGYLTKLSNKNVYKDVAGRLTPEEVAELMAAYANSVFGTQPTAIPPSALNLDANPAK